MTRPSEQGDYGPELITYIIDPDLELDVDLFTKALGSPRHCGGTQAGIAPGPGALFRELSGRIHAAGRYQVF